MATRYQIWNRTDPVITPIGECLTAAQWIARYPAAGSIPYVLAAGEINGAFCAPLSQMVSIYTAQGADFSACATAEEKLDAIEAFEDAQASAEPAMSTSDAALLNIAAQLEFQNMMSLPDDESAGA